ncbi:tripartite tricarboxylate transporter substrate binding protein [Roseomonas sp. GCM10028921]
MMNVTRICMGRRRLIGGGGLLLAGSATRAQSQPAMPGWPNRPVRLVVPFAPGGANDVAARLLGNRLAETLGQPAVVENRAGANGIVGLQAVAQAPADGHTLVVASAGPIAVNPALYYTLPYDPERSFAPITNLAMLPLLLVVNPVLPATNTAELVALARSRPGQLAYASPGTGNSGHLAGELFDSVAGVRTVHVPYRGNGPAVADLLSGQVPMMWSSVPPVIDHIRTGRLRVLCVGSARRLDTMPDVPTAAESGVLPGYEAYSWVGLLAPAGTPATVVARLNAECWAFLADPPVRAAMEAQGMIPDPTTPEAFAAFIHDEVVKWGTVVRAAGVRLE